MFLISCTTVSIGWYTYIYFHLYQYLLLLRRSLRWRRLSPSRMLPFSAGPPGCRRYQYLVISVHTYIKMLYTESYNSYTRTMNTLQFSVYMYSPIIIIAGLAISIHTHELYTHKCMHLIPCKSEVHTHINIHVYVIICSNLSSNIQSWDNRYGLLYLKQSINQSINQFEHTHWYTLYLAISVRTRAFIHVIIPSNLTSNIRIDTHYILPSQFVHVHLYM